MCVCVLYARSNVLNFVVESILAIRDVGIQVKTTYWGGSSVSRFINRNKIDDVIINEGISFWQIKSYMAILVKDEDKMVVVFEVSFRYPHGLFFFSSRTLTHKKHHSICYQG